MAKKIFISPSNQNGNSYAYGKTNEAEQCGRIGKAVDAASDAGKAAAGLFNKAKKATPK